MTHQIYEGTWEEISRHANELAGRRVRLTILDEPRNPQPNEAMLAVLEKIAERQKNRPVTQGDDTQTILREGRAGKMFGYECDK